MPIFLFKHCRTKSEFDTVESRPCRRTSYKKSEKTVKFFFKVVLPLVEKYFSHHRAYFTAMATATTSAAGNDGSCV